MRQSWSTRPGRTGIYSTRGSRRGLRNARSRQVGVEKVNEQEGAWAWAWAVGLRGVVVGRRRVSEAASTARSSFEIRKLRARAASVRLGAGGR